MQVMIFILVVCRRLVWYQNVCCILWKLQSVLKVQIFVYLRNISNVQIRIILCKKDRGLLIECSFYKRSAVAFSYLVMN